MDSTIARILSLAGVQKPTLVEGSMSRLLAHVESEDFPFAILSASRGEYKSSENRARNTDLASGLRGLHLGYVPILGSYIEDTGKKVSEQSFFVIGNKKMPPEKFVSAITGFGEAYDQDSVLVGTPDASVRLISTNDNDYIGPKGSEKPLGRFSPTRIGDYFSEWKGRPFTFRSLD